MKTNASLLVFLIVLPWVVLIIFDSIEVLHKDARQEIISLEKVVNLAAKTWLALSIVDLPFFSLEGYRHISHHCHTGVNWHHSLMGLRIARLVHEVELFGRGDIAERHSLLLPRVYVVIHPICDWSKHFWDNLQVDLVFESENSV